MGGSAMWAIPKEELMDSLCGRHSGVHRDPPRPESQQCGQRYRLSDKIRAVEKQSIAAELETALFVSVVLKLGIASVALTGATEASMC